MLGTVGTLTEPFVPTMFGSGTVLWLTGSNGIVTSGNNVTGWTDQTAYHNNAATTSSTPPTLATTINGLPCVQFSRDNLTQMQIPDAASLSPTAAISVSVVIQFQRWQFGQFGPFDCIILKSSNEATATDGWGLVNNTGSDSAGNLDFFVNQWDGNFAPVTGIVTNTNYILTCIYTGTAINFYVNGVLGGTFAYSTPISYPAPGNVLIGFANTWDAITASVAEIVITNFALSTDQRQLLERRYFGPRYGISA